MNREQQLALLDLLIRECQRRWPSGYGAAEFRAVLIEIGFDLLVLPPDQPGPKDLMDSIYASVPVIGGDA